MTNSVFWIAKHIEVSPKMSAYITMIFKETEKESIQ